MRSLMSPAAPKKLTRPPTARAKCDAFGLEAICARVVGGESMTAVAAEIGVHISTLIEWLEDDAQRSARMRAARSMAARVWDEKAEQGLATASDPFELSRAKELAHHYRWRAKAVAPREYGDKLTQEHIGAGGGPITIAAVDLKNLSDSELEQMQRLLSKTQTPTE